MPGKPLKNLSVTSLPKPTFLKLGPGMLIISGSPSCVFISISKRLILKRAMAISWILPRLWSRRSTSIQVASGVTMRYEARLSSAVPHSTAFLPPAFMATLPPMQLASADVGSQANSRPASVAASIARRVTTPAPHSMVATWRVTPGNVRICTPVWRSSFSVLITTDNGVSGIAPPV